MPCLLVFDSEYQSGVLQLQSGEKVQDLPNNKQSTSVPKSTLLLSTELSRKAQNRINLDKSVTKVVLAVETVMVWGGILLHVVKGGYGTHVGALELR